MNWICWWWWAVITGDSKGTMWQAFQSAGVDVEEENHGYPAL